MWVNMPSKTWKVVLMIIQVNVMDVWPFVPKRPNGSNCVHFIRLFTIVVSFFCIAYVLAGLGLGCVDKLLIYCTLCYQCRFVYYIVGENRGFVTESDWWLWCFLQVRTFPQTYMVSYTCPSKLEWRQSNYR